MIKIYNTLTRQLEPFKPIEEGRVRMYVCGPTVYHYIHIGNARSAVAFDTIRKYLICRGYDVQYVSNFTDVDDKILNAAKQAGIPPEELSKRYIEAFFEDTQALNVMPADKHPTVTDNMDSIIAFIQALIDKDYAYVSGGDVYYKTRQFKAYGLLSGIAIDDLEAGASARLDSAQRDLKHDPLDFALWKSAQPGEVAWESPWGHGRPGWHIECSVMATKELGDTIDIHAGGQDLQFPHHENEIAQTEAKTGKRFANYWLHNGFVTMGDEKMSKSLGNVKLIHDLKQLYDPQVLRFFLATAHYRKPISYSEQVIQEAGVNLQKINTTLSNIHHRRQIATATLPSDKQTLAEWDVLTKRFFDHMDMDFQTQNGITDIYEMIRYVNTYMQLAEVSKLVLDKVLEDLVHYLYIFGVEWDQQEPELLDTAIQDLIDQREQARAQKDYQTADTIRDTLQARGIILEDTAQGVRFKRVSTDES